MYMYGILFNVSLVIYKLTTKYSTRQNSKINPIILIS